MFKFQNWIVCSTVFTVMTIITSPIMADTIRQKDAGIDATMHIGTEFGKIGIQDNIEIASTDAARVAKIGTQSDIASAIIQPSIPANIAIASIGINNIAPTNALGISKIGIQSNFTSAIVRPSMSANTAIASIGINDIAPINAIGISKIGIQSDITSAIIRPSIPANFAIASIGTIDATSFIQGGIVA